MKNQYTENELRRGLGRDMQLSGEVENRLQEVYGAVRAGKVKQQTRRTYWKQITGSAVAAAAAGVILVANPAIAEKIPFIGYIFAQVEEQASFKGNYEEVGTALESETQKGEVKNYVQSADGLTMTLSEVYCSPAALYVTMKLKADEAFPGTLIDQQGNPVIGLKVKANYSYNATMHPVFSYLDGKMVDDHTYLGMMRIDLQDTVYDASAYVEAEKKAEGAGEEMSASYDDLVKVVEIPDQFTVQLTIDQVIGDRSDPVSIYEAAGMDELSEDELSKMSQEELTALHKELEEKVPDYYDEPSKYTAYWYDGPFTFDLDVQVDTERSVCVPVDKQAEGYYIDSVTLTPFELMVKEENQTSDGWLVVLDGQGRKLRYGERGGYCNVFQIEGMDMSKVTLYQITWDEVESLKIKGDEYFDERGIGKEGEVLRDVLDEHAWYKREVELKK